MNIEAAYQELRRCFREIALINSGQAVLLWDMQTFMPPASQSFRAEQMALFAGESHKRACDPAIGELLAQVESHPDSDPLSPMGVNIREWRRAYDRLTRIPLDLQTALTRAAAEGRGAWESAKQANDWGLFAPKLAEIVSLKIQEAQAVGYQGEAYDALLNAYEPGATTQALEPVLRDLAKGLALLVWEIMDQRRPESDLLRAKVPREKQEALARRMVEKLGYDFQAGRLDPTAHPFCTEIGPRDVRITTNFESQDFTASLFAAMHETGHALYSLGLPAEHWGEPMGTALSMGLHESQSRFWENCVARSFSFWKHFYPILQETLGALSGVPLADFHQAVTAVNPGLIRVQADEVTYNLHIVLRFDLELALLRGQLSVADLPGAWQEKMRDLLGLVPPDHASGVLQDVHWSMGHFGYFPTYALGNIYAAHLFAKAREVFPDMAESFAAGEFSFLLDWLRSEVHSQGGRYHPAGVLIEKVTGQTPSARVLLDHLRQKYLTGMDI